MRLHRSLDDDGPLPLAYLISRICEEFCCLPSAAMAELRSQPVGWIEEVMEARLYAKAKQRYDLADDKAIVGKEDPMTRAVMENEFAHAKEHILRRRARMKGPHG